MMDRWKPWLLPIGLVGALFGGYLIIAVLTTGILETGKFWEGEAPAAWAQAIFSVLAIYVAARVTALPGLTVRRQRLSALLGLVDKCVELQLSAAGFAEYIGSGGFDFHRFDTASAAYNAGAAFHEVVPWELVWALLQLQEDLVKARAEMEAQSQTPGFWPVRIALLRAMQRHAEETLEKVQLEHARAQRLERYWLWPLRG